MRKTQDQLDDLLEEWHTKGFGIPVYEYFGWTEEQYARWVENASTIPDEAPKKSVIHEVYQERLRQDLKWGEQSHPNGTGGPGRVDDANKARKFCDESFRNGTGTWAAILGEEVAEALAESDPEKLRTELLQCAAVCTAWVEAIDRLHQR